MKGAEKFVYPHSMKEIRPFSYHYKDGLKMINDLNFSLILWSYRRTHKGKFLDIGVDKSFPNKISQHEKQKQT